MQLRGHSSIEEELVFHEGRDEAERQLQPKKREGGEAKSRIMNVVCVCGFMNDYIRGWNGVMNLGGVWCEKGN